MKKKIDLLITNIGQLITCNNPGEPLRGAEMGQIEAFENTAVAIHDGIIESVGTSHWLPDVYDPEQVVDAGGNAVIPGFVDPHTHTIFGGDRAHEFEMRISGATYMEIMAAGGGIVSTMKHTRESSEGELFASAKARLDEMLALGSTTVEIKTGYGLDTDTELKMLRVIEQLDLAHPCDIVPTFLGAHTLPPEFKDNGDGYVDLVVNEMIPAVMDWYQASHFAKNKTPLFIDVFCEDHAFDVPQTERILKAGLAAGMLPKIHVDQFNEFGGLEMALELGAVSVDHLDVTSEQGIQAIADSKSVAVPLPAVTFNLGIDQYANARAMLDGGTAVALATDLNPGSAPCYSMPMTMAIACRFQKMLPAEALHASTINAAYAIGLGHKVGSIQVGKQADLLILKQPDYRHLCYFFGQNPVGIVIKDGQEVLSTKAQRV
ncbi:MAG: imidazolonepropionase [Chloroflexota bacterium]